MSILDDKNRIWGDFEEELTRQQITNAIGRASTTLRFQGVYNKLPDPYDSSFYPGIIILINQQETYILIEIHNSTSVFRQWQLLN